MSKVLFTTADLVRLSNGTVDESGTADAFANALSAYIAADELQTETVAAAVGAVFDKYPGTRMNMPFIIGQALTHLNVQPETEKTLRERVHTYIQQNADQDPVYATDPKTGKVIGKGDERVEVTPAEEDRTRMFGIGKGKAGGVVRWSDVPVKPAK